MYFNILFFSFPPLFNQLGGWKSKKFFRAKSLLHCTYTSLNTYRVLLGFSCDSAASKIKRTSIPKDLDQITIRTKSRANLSTAALAGQQCCDEIWKHKKTKKNFTWNFYRKFFQNKTRVSEKEKKSFSYNCECGISLRWSFELLALFSLRFECLISGARNNLKWHFIWCCFNECLGLL